MSGQMADVSAYGGLAAPPPMDPFAMLMRQLYMRQALARPMNTMWNPLMPAPRGSGPQAGNPLGGNPFMRATPAPSYGGLNVPGMPSFGMPGT